MSLSRVAPPRSSLLRLLGGLAFVWAGIVVGISFLEAPVKFTAPSLTLPVGLDVGRHVFAALNRTELVLALASAVLVWSARARRGVWMALGVAWLVVLVQTAWLLPALDARAVVIIAGGHPPASTGLHLLYGLAEGLKVLALLAAGGVASRPAVAPRPDAADAAPRSAPVAPLDSSPIPALSHTPISDP